MGERFGSGAALSLLLQPVVADGLCQFQTLLQVAILHRVIHGLLVVGPHTGIVVGQQLQAHADLVGLRLARLAHGLVGFRQRTSEVLHMVTNLMGNDVGVCKRVTLNAQLTLHLREERQVDIEFLVARAIERTDGCRCRAAGGVHLIAEQHERRILVLTPAILSKHLGPDVLCAGQNLLALCCQCLLLLGEALLTDGFCGCLHLLLHHVLNDVAQVSSLHEGHQSNDDNTSQATDSGLGTRAHSAAIFHVRAFSSTC